ncbi:MAG: glycoside hydrolase family 3 C-terminal domain-containing protein [Candidatus Glassbacteria bacterium]
MINSKISFLVALCGASTLLVAIFAGCLKRERYSFQDASLPVEARVADLVSRMTVDEKISQTSFESPAIERLGIPAFNWWNECLHGVARAGVATVFPQAIGLAATWDTEMMRRVSGTISDEARAKYNESVRSGQRRIYQGLTFWSPNINIFRDPRWGRGMETYGEDPFLTGKMGVEFVKGLQGEDPRYLKVVATAKHFAVHSGPEPLRHSFDAVVSNRDLHDTYLRAFRMLVDEGGAWSVMCAYNRVEGEACCASPLLLMRILRDRWKFGGYVVSDCWAVRDIHTGHKIAASIPEAAALALKAGCDLNCGDAFREGLKQALDEGLITTADLDRALTRLFTARFRLGVFDPAGSTPWDSLPYSVNDCGSHRALALEAAQKSMVLLKNEGTLPLSRQLKRLAVIGPTACSLDVLQGNYNGTPSDFSTVLEGIREKLPSGQVLYARGCPVAESVESYENLPYRALLPQADNGGRKGYKVEIFAAPEIGGSPVSVEFRDLLDVGGENRWPGKAVAGAQGRSIRWTAGLVPPLDGVYGFSLSCNSAGRLSIGGKTVIEKEGDQPTATGSVELGRGTAVDLVLETTHIEENSSVTLNWRTPDETPLDQALDQAETIVLCLGLTPSLEGEEMDVSAPGFLGGDRTSLDLPQPQKDLLARAAATGKPLVVVLLNGSALAVNEAQAAAGAILEAWYPGEEGGRAVADVLFGDSNPAGRLPVTFYRSIDQLPAFEDYAMQGRTYRFFNGEPLYPFGYGLSYTRFAYSGLAIEPLEIAPGQEVEVTVQVTNAGGRAGEEVVQLYLTDVEAGVPVPLRALRGFQRIRLEPGQTREVSFRLSPGDMSLFDEQEHELIEPGAFRVSVGGRQPGPAGSADTSTTEVLTGGFTVKGDVTILE